MNNKTHTMMKSLAILLIAVAFALNATAQTGTSAQDTMKGGNTIEVIQSYKPQIKQAPKPELSPGLPPTDTSHPVFVYEVPRQTLYYTYSSEPLRPLALGHDTVKIPYPNYVKLGAGNLNTLYLDAGIGSLRGDNYETGIHLHYLSQKGNIQYQQSALAGIEADGSLHTGKNVWHGMIDAEQNQFNYYGYDHDLYQYNSDSVKQAFTSLKLGVDMQNEPAGYHNFSYHPAVTASLYTDKFKAAETTIGFDLPFFYNVDTFLQFKLGLNGVFTQLKTADSTHSNNIIMLVPGASFHKKAFSLHAYLDPAIGQSGNVYFLPDVAAGYGFLHNMLRISAGWQALLRQNTYEQLSTENPYMLNTYSVLQTRSDEVFVNADAAIGDHITLSGRVSWWAYDNLPVFLNNFGDQRKFAVAYDTKLNATSLLGAIRYQVANTLSVGFNASFYHFYNGSTQYVWNEPSVRFKGDLMFRPIHSLTITAYLSALEDIYALGANNDVQKLKSIFDIGLNAEYDIIPRLSVFVQTTNLLNDKYQRWLGYQAYGINVYGGLRLKF